MSEGPETAKELAEANHSAIAFLSLQQSAMAVRLRALAANACALMDRNRSRAKLRAAG
jgi:hypothetical protein